jgi:thymidylate synthase (FAD)
MIEINLINYTQNPEVTIASAARTCFRNKCYESICEELKEEDIERIIKTVILKNHLSVLEHITFTFSISGVSRVLTHQLVRHRIASYSQLSQQRTDSSELKFTVPPEIQKQPVLAKEYEETATKCQELYKRLVKSGISRGSARYILPSSFNTRIMTTMNARSLFNLFAQRECQAEEWEFRQLARLIHDKLMEVTPMIFKYAGPACQTRGICPEGKRVYECGGYFGVTLLQPEIKKEPELVG